MLASPVTITCHTSNISPIFQWFCSSVSPLWLLTMCLTKMFKIDSLFDCIHAALYPETLLIIYANEYQGEIIFCLTFRDKSDRTSRV